jgi:hypothetical protein
VPGNAQSEDMDLFREINGTLSIDAHSSMGYYVVQASWATLRFGGLRDLYVLNNIPVANAAPL